MRVNDYGDRDRKRWGHFSSAAISVLFFLCIASANLTEELVFGATVKQLAAIDIAGNKQAIPQESMTTLLFFFNIDYSPHVRMLSEVDFLLVNLSEINDNIKFIAVSHHSAVDKFAELKKTFAGRLGLVNDKEKEICKAYAYTCGNCIKLVLVDQHGKLRYLSASLDPFMLREVVLRYGRGE